MYSTLNSQYDHDLRDCVDLEKKSEKEIIQFFIRITFLPERCLIYMLYYFFVFHLFFKKFSMFYQSNSQLQFIIATAD